MQSVNQELAQDQVEESRKANSYRKRASFLPPSLMLIVLLCNLPFELSNTGAFYPDLCTHFSSNCHLTHIHRYTMYVCAPCPTPNPLSLTTYSSQCCSVQLTEVLTLVGQPASASPQACNALPLAFCLFGTHACATWKCGELTSVGLLLTNGEWGPI